MRFQTNSVKTERDFIVRTRNFLGGGGEGAYLGSICQGIWARSPPPHNSPPLKIINDGFWKIALTVESIDGIIDLIFGRLHDRFQELYLKEMKKCFILKEYPLMKSATANAHIHLLLHRRVRNTDIGMFAVTAASRLKTGPIITIIMTARIMTI